MCDYTPDSTCALPNSLQAPSFARGFVQSALCLEHAQTAEAVVTLLTDELVTQALLYGAPPVSLTVRCCGSEVAVEVSDSAPEPPDRPAPDQELSRLLVDKISHSWGVERVESGKRVWCRVPSGALPKPRAPLPWSVEQVRATTAQGHRG